MEQNDEEYNVKVLFNEQYAKVYRYSTQYGWHVQQYISSINQVDTFRGTGPLKLSARVQCSKFHVGDKVRIRRKKGTFEKGFTPNWTEEQFTISSVKPTNPTMYTIKDQLGEPVRGSFYEQELQLSVQEIFHIERVLRKNRNQVYVKWKGCSNSFNSWIPIADLEA